MKYLKIILVFCLSLSCHRLFAQKKSSFGLQDSLKAREVFAQCKSEFSSFETGHGHFVNTNNVRMHYLTWGTPKGKPFLWVHGTYSNGYELYEIADSLVKSGYYVIAIDYYGHGVTPIPLHEVSLYHVADDIHFLLGELGIKKTVMGGWSRGGAIVSAFYDSYPECVSAIILEDGGSVPWSINDHKKEIDTLTKEIRSQYKNSRPQRTFATEFDAFYGLYKYFLHDKSGSELKKGIFTFLARVKKNQEDKYMLDPGVPDFVCLATADQLLTLKFRPLAGHTLFGISSEILNPQIIYRNLSVPMLIFDPVGENDWFDFEEGNKKLQKEHPHAITHRIYKETGHAVKDEKKWEFLNDVIYFLKATGN